MTNKYPQLKYYSYFISVYTLEDLKWDKTHQI